jgi:ABC-type sulfate transport system permease component
VTDQDIIEAESQRESQLAATQETNRLLNSLRFTAWISALAVVLAILFG